MDGMRGAAEDRVRTARRELQIVLQVGVAQLSSKPRIEVLPHHDACCDTGLEAGGSRACRSASVQAQDGAATTGPANFPHLGQTGESGDAQENRESDCQSHILLTPRSVDRRFPEMQ